MIEMYLTIMKKDQLNTDFIQGSQNKGWQWTPALRKQFLEIGEKLYNAIREAVKEAEELRKHYDEELTKPQKYWDYEIELIAIPSTLPATEENINEQPYSVKEFTHEYRVWQKQLDENPLITDRSLSWNIEDLEDFKDEGYIPYYMHILICHLYWKFSDVLNIDHLWLDTHVFFQIDRRKDKHIHNKRIIKMK